MVRIFRRVGLRKNLSKTKAMICTPVFIWGKQVFEAYKWRDTGEVSTFLKINRTRVSCKDCGGTMDASSMRHHMERSHGKVLQQVRGVDVGGGGQEFYKDFFPRILNLVE